MINKADSIIFAILLSVLIVTPFTFPLHADDNAGQLTYVEIEELLKAERIDEAERMLKEYIDEDPKDHVALSLLGRLYLDKGDKRAASRALSKAVKLSPDYPMVHLYLGRFYFLMQKSDDAVKEFNIFIQKMKPMVGADPTTKRIYIKDLHYICDKCFNLKRYDEFKKTIKEILALDPLDQTAIYNLGVYYYVAEHLRSKAYDSFKKASEIDPDSHIGQRAKYAIEYIRANPDSRVAPDFSFIDKEYR